MILLPHGVNPFLIIRSNSHYDPTVLPDGAIFRIAELSETHCQLQQALHQERLDENNG